MKKLFALLGVILLSSAVFATGQQDSHPATESSETGVKSIIIGLTTEPSNLDPVLIAGIDGETLASNIFDTLVSYKENPSIPSPGLAESWTISDDGTVYTFKLREGVSFHDGTPFTSADVKYTIEECLNPANASPSAEFFSPVASIETPDDYTVVINLTSSYGPFLLALGNPASGIIPKALVSEIGHDAFDRAPVGTGPFKFVEWVPDERIVLERNEDYFLGTPHIERAVFRPIPKMEVMAAELKAGGIDVAASLLPQDLADLEGNSDFMTYSIPGLSNTWLGFNYKMAPYSDVRFRKAVYYALPMEQAVKGIYGDSAERAYTWIPDGVFPDDKAFMKKAALPYDTEKAKALFDELKADGTISEGQEIEVWLGQKAQRVQMATVIATELAKYGLKVKVNSVESGTFFDKVRSEEGAGIYLLGWGSVPDPDRWTYKIFHTGSSTNFSKYEVPEIDALLEEGRQLSDPDARGEVYKKIMRKTLAEDYIHIPVVFQKVSAATGSNVTGFRPVPQGYIILMASDRNVDIK